MTTVEQAWLDELSELLRIPSISADPAHGGDVQAAAGWVAAKIRRGGGVGEVLDWQGHPLAVGEIRASENADSAPTVLCYGHFDVQPPAPLDLWTTEPFEPTVRDEWLYARGVADDKGQLWMLLEAEFLAIALVLVYVGAVMVLFLFVVMMLDINLDRLREGYWDYVVPALIVAGVMLAEMFIVLGGRYFDLEGMPRPQPREAGYSNTKELGRVLYTDYVYAFEIAAVILLVAIVAAIALTLRHRKDTKFLDPAAQVRVRREERVRMVRMPAEKPGE